MNNLGQKLVSVIIPAYNIEKHISQAIESVIGQSYKNIEIIMVNDGSTDGTEKIIQHYAKKDGRIIILNQSNGGVSAARNYGFRIAKGEYFCILDADDIMMPEKIKSQIDFLEQNPSADLTYSKVYYFFDGTYDIYRHDLATVSGDAVYKQLLKYGNFIYTGTVCFKRSVFDSFGGFDARLRSAEEFDYWLFLADKGVNFLYQDKYLTLCRSRENGLSSDSVTMYSTAVTVFEKHISKNKFLSKITSFQYLKARLLLSFSKLRKQKYFNRLFALLRKLKFLLTFKKVTDKKLKEYLITLESHKPL